MTESKCPVKCPVCGNPLFFVKSNLLLRQYVTAQGALANYDEYHKCVRCRNPISVKHNKFA